MLIQIADAPSEDCRREAQKVAWKSNETITIDLMSVNQQLSSQLHRICKSLKRGSVAGKTSEQRKA